MGVNEQAPLAKFAAANKAHRPGHDFVQPLLSASTAAQRGLCAINVHDLIKRTSTGLCSPCNASGASRQACLLRVSRGAASHRVCACTSS